MMGPHLACLSALPCLALPVLRRCVGACGVCLVHLRVCYACVCLFWCLGFLNGADVVLQGD